MSNVEGKELQVLLRSQCKKSRLAGPAWDIVYNMPKAYSKHLR